MNPAPIAPTFFDTKYDPYGFRSVARSALKPASSYQKLKSAVNYHGGFAVGLLPFVSLLVTPILTLVYDSALLKYFAIAQWLYFFYFVAFHFRLLPRKVDVYYNGTRKNRVIVIGAGPAGLAAIKECKAQGLEVTCYEKNTGVGGVYLFPNPNPGGVWKGVRLTSSAWITSFSDFPPLPNVESTHWMHHEYHQYLDAYAKRFGLLDHIKFGHTVSNLEQCKKGKWHITCMDADGNEVKQDADGVIVCSGTHQRPKAVPVPGAENFTGEIKAMAECKDPDAFVGKRVLVVGNGESATDFAAVVSRTAKRSFLSMRRGKITISRCDPKGKPRDHLTTRVRHALPPLARNWFVYHLKKRAALFFSGRNPGAAVSFNMLDSSGLGVSCQLATKTETYVAPFLADKMEFRKQISGFDGKNVIYEDGVSEPMDVVVFAHGYDQGFPWLKVDNIPHPGEMYMRMFMPKVGDSIAFCGFARPAVGSIPPLAEMQARFAALVMAGRRTLPCQLKMGDAIYEQRRESRELFPMMEQPSTAISYVRYLDFLADRVGCRPSALKLLADPAMLYNVMTGPVIGALYRLHGEGSSDVAWESVKSLGGDTAVRDVITFIGILWWMFPFALMSDHRSTGLHNTML